MKTSVFNIFLPCAHRRTSEMFKNIDLKTAAVRMSWLFTDLWQMHSASTTLCGKCDERGGCSSSREHQIKMPPLRNWMECFQTDSKIGFQFLPSDKLSPVANYSHCQLTLQPAPSEPLRESACQICFCLSRQHHWWKQTGKFWGAAQIEPNIIV